MKQSFTTGFEQMPIKTTREVTMSEEQESGTKLKQLAELALRQAEYFKDAEKKVYAQVNWWTC